MHRKASSRARGLVAALILASVMVSPTPASAVGTPKFFPMGVYDDDGDPVEQTRIAAAGFNTINALADRDSIDAAYRAGFRVVVWLGTYKNSTCAFERNNDWIAQRVKAIRGHPAIIAYQIADEPSRPRCPSARQQIAARSAFVKSLDPVPDTYIVVSAWNGRELFPYQDFAGATDVMGLDLYPCSHLYGCRFGEIDKAIAHAETDGVRRYWAVIQGFQDVWYRLPTADELADQFDRWRASRMEGYFVFSWEFGDPDAYLKDRPDLVAALTVQNAYSRLQ